MNTHTFHIPVLGIGYSVATPLKAAPLGINSVVSLVDDILLEKLRKYYSEKNGLPFNAITDKHEDCRAARITAYLDLIHDLVNNKISDLKLNADKKIDELKNYFSLLPEHSPVKKEFFELLKSKFEFGELKNWLHENLRPGNIDVNIMTKVDTANYKNGMQQPVEFNDAHAAVRGFAKSKLKSTLVLSAGMNPRLYGYLNKFKEFIPNEFGVIKKKIALKVSDFRSALIQGKFLAKKGIWVSEFRIESGLNCGGHAFATDGHLMGPILADFRDKRNELINTMKEALFNALNGKIREYPELKITAQGGVGTSEEHEFLINYYNLDSVGWGSPFLLVPEAVTIDKFTLNKLAGAKEDDLYLSGISPLGVPFNSMRGNSKDIEKFSLAAKGRPGSSCPKKFIEFNKEFTDKPICTASRQYQHLKLNELKEKYGEVPQKMYQKVIEKACLCLGLTSAVDKTKGFEPRKKEDGVSVCPGPNIAYFEREMSFREIVDHIYGRINVISRSDRPNLFIKELGLYIDYLKNKIEESAEEFSEKNEKYFNSFIHNLKNGINYYYDLFDDAKEYFNAGRKMINAKLEQFSSMLDELANEISNKQLTE